MIKSILSSPTVISQPIPHQIGCGKLCWSPTIWEDLLEWREHGLEKGKKEGDVKL